MVKDSAGYLLLFTFLVLHPTDPDAQQKVMEFSVFHSMECLRDSTVGPSFSSHFSRVQECSFARHMNHVT